MIGSSNCLHIVVVVVAGGGFVVAAAAAVALVQQIGSYCFFRADLRSDDSNYHFYFFLMANSSLFGLH